MNKLNFLLGLVASAFWILSSTTQAASIDYGATSNFIEVPSGMLSAVGNYVEIGTFPANYDFSQNSTDYTATSQAFTLYGTTTIGSSNLGAGQFFDTTPSLTGVSGKTLYVWVFNDPNPTNATAWAIVTNNSANWKGPSDTNTTSLDTSDVGTFVPTGALGSIVAVPVSTSNPNGFDVRMSPVPEPSTYALLGVGILGFGLLNRRLRQETRG